MGTTIRKIRVIRANFPEFIKKLVKQGQFSILYDSYLMDIVVALVIGLSESKSDLGASQALLLVMLL